MFHLDWIKKITEKNIIEGCFNKQTAYNKQSKINK